MKKKSIICGCVLVSLLLASLPAFGENGSKVENGQPAIVKVYGKPIGIESNFKYGQCQIQYGVLPMNAAKVAPGKALRIKVVGGDDVIVLCNGEKGITISRD